MICTTPYCGTKVNNKTVKYIYDKDVMRIACNFHYADWKERNKNAKLD
jgi:hypothetical protein